MPSLLFGASPTRIERGEFTCPECRDARPYDRVEVRRTIRITARWSVPVGRLGEYVECADCSLTWRPEVLAYDAGDSTATIMAEYQRVVKRLLALMVVTDGVIAEPEIATVQEVFEAVSGRSLGRAEVLQEVQEVVRTPATAARYLASVTGYLNEYGKEQVLRAAAMVSRSDGTVHARERELVVRLGGVMRTEPVRIGRVLREFA
jgi:hypothetical protein